MSIAEDPVRGRQLSKLMLNKLGHHLDWKVPVILDIVGPYDPSIFQRYDERRRKIVNECQDRLAQFSDDQIHALIDQRRDDPDEVVNEWTGFLREEIYQLGRRQPAWFAGGFGHPEFEADFNYWGQMEEFTLHEALMLSVGVEPKHFSEDLLTKARRDQEKIKLSPCIEFLVRRHELFVRKFPSGGFGLMSVPPSFLANWFEEVDLRVHPDFLEVIHKRVEFAKNPQKGRINSRSDGGDAQRMDRREVDKIAQLFTAMAIEQLGYNPNERRSPITKEITDLASSMGMEVSDDTVRKYLKLGAKFIPDDWKPR